MMDNQPGTRPVNYSRKGYLTIIGFSVAGILLNLLLSKLPGVFNWPLYLDSLGTVLAAVLGGYLPGILAGYLSNVINGISDGSSIYYSTISVLLAIAAAYFGQRDDFRKPLGIIKAILIFSLIGGGLGSVVTWLLSGRTFGDVASRELTQSIFSSGQMSAFWSQFSADYLVDLADKTIIVLLAALILNLIPKSVKARLYAHGWNQAPLERKSLKEASRKMFRRVSLRTKVTLFLTLAISILSIIICGFSFVLYHSAFIEQETHMAEGVASVIHDSLDPEMVDTYIAEGKSSPAYQEVSRVLTELYNSSPDIAYIYVYRIEEDGCHVVFDVDTPDLEGASPGTVVEFDESFGELIPKLLAGENIDPIITDDTYGWLLSMYRPVYNAAGKCVCYACVDISMDELRVKEHIFFTRVIAIFMGFLILLLAAAFWFSDYSLIIPINSMAVTSGNFAYDTETNRADSIQKLSGLDIRTGDELENLYYSILKTSTDAANSIAESHRKTEQIDKMQRGLIYVLADLVESRDKNTGNHIRNTAAYVDILLRQMKKEGIYADALTDEFCDDVRNSAPLHDVGKIAVSDVILNKPGKLTDEEFAIMKGHAAAGGEIIHQAINAVSEENSGYLKEAANLASYHHEKWDGTGYPCGLAGEEIPLSARVMAVADVFDALVSRRAYKEGFPYEKAFDIIREGAGKHFDPQIAEAFLHAEDEVRAVADDNRMKYSG